MTVITDAKHIATHQLSEVSEDKNALLLVKQLDGSSSMLREQMFLPHRRDYYFFFLVTKGGSRHWVDFVSYIVQPHTLYFTLPHQVHLKERSEPTEGILLGFTDEFLALCNDEGLRQLPIIKNKFAKHAITLGEEDEEYITDILQKLLAEFDSTNTYKQEALQAYIKLFLINASRLYNVAFADDETTEHNNSLFIKLLHLLDKSPIQWERPSDYADTLNVTVGHLNVIVKQQCGKTLTDLLQERFILEAKRLLFHSKLSVKEIGYKLNFDDAAYFNRVFKKLAGITPMEFRKQTHEKYN